MGLSELVNRVEAAKLIQDATQRGGLSFRRPLLLLVSQRTINDYTCYSL